MNIINNILQSDHEIEQKVRKEITHILKRVIDQNYFQFDLHYIKSDGLAMGAPTSAILAETCIPNMKHTNIPRFK
jgi:hypothetical protein